jgi:multidrug resistance efflux pump
MCRTNSIKSVGRAFRLTACFIPLVFFYTSCTKIEVPQITEELTKVRVLPVQATTTQPTLELTGTVISQEIARVHPEVSGIVITVQVREGDHVSKNQVLANLDPADFKLNLIIAQAEHERAMAAYQRMVRGYRPEDIQSAKARYENAIAMFMVEETNLERNRNLYQSEVMTEKDWTGYLKKLDAQRALVASSSAEFTKMIVGYEPYDIQEASAAASLAKAREDLAKRDLEQCAILAPITGVITRRQVEVGQLITQQNELFEIQDPDRTWLQVEVGEKQAHRIEVGQKADLRADALSSPGHGKVDRIGRVLNPTTHSLPVWISWDAGQLIPPVGAFAQATLSLNSVSEIYVLQREWIHLSEGAHFVWIVEKGLLAQRFVTIAEDTGDRVTIPKNRNPAPAPHLPGGTQSFASSPSSTETGLENGLQVVVSPPNNFRVGMAVKTETYLPTGTLLPTAPPQEQISHLIPTVAPSQNSDWSEIR